MKLIAPVCGLAAVLNLGFMASAYSAPAQLLGKSVQVSFAVSASARAEDGSVTNRQRQVQRTIYISSKGRVFTQVDRQVGRLSDTQQRGPDVTAGRFRFEGNRLIGVNLGMVSGAAQLVVDFDSGFQSCTARVSFGRESGREFKFKGLDGKTYTATGVPTATTPSCSIRAGNPFGD